MTKHPFNESRAPPFIKEIRSRPFHPPIMHTANPNYLLFPEPLLGTSSAHLLSLIFATTYVGSIYFSRRTRLSLRSRNTKSDTDDAGHNPTKGTRDDPDIIRARLLAVSVATVVCCAGVFSVLWGRMRWDANVSTYSYYSLSAYLTNFFALSLM